MIQLLYRCESIKHCLGYRRKLDESGHFARSENGQHIYEHAENRMVRLVHVEGKRSIDMPPPPPWGATPGVQIVLDNLTAEAGDKFKVGQKYWINFTPEESTT